VAGRDAFTATDGHPVMTSEGWRDAVMLKVGNKVQVGPTGEGENSEFLLITDISITTEKIPVFNIEVANAHTYYVGDDGVLVHNACKRIPSKTHRNNWEKANPGQTWPKTADGRNYHVEHEIPLADGGPDTLDNIRPMHPDDHVKHHKDNGDSARWGKMGGKKKK
jgi:hypothetical protein